MAVPKKRTGKSAQGHRRSNWKATKPEITKCTNCGATALAHTVCTACGYYKGQPVRLKDKPEIVEEKPAKKKKPAAKVTKAEVVVEEKVEEVKLEAEEVQAVNETETAEDIEKSEE